MKSSVLLSAVRKGAAVAAVAGLLAVSAPFAFADQTFTATLSSSEPVAPATTAANPIPVTVDFSTPVKSFDGSNVTTNGSVTSVTASSTDADEYTFEVTPSASGTTTVSIAGDAVQDNADNVHTNSASNELDFLDTASTSGGGLASTTTTSASSTEAFVTLQDGSGNPLFSGTAGTPFNVVGTEFWANEQVAIGFDGATTTVTADPSGGFTEQLIAGSDQSGASQITAIGETSGLVAANSFFVNGATVLPTGGSTSTGPNAPVITMTSGPADGSSIASTSVTFGFTVNDPTAATTCALDGGIFTCGSPVTVTASPDGAYVFSVTAASSTGISTSTINFAVDTHAPIITEITPVANPNDGTAAQYTFTSNEAGTSTLSGGCSTASNTVNAGSNTITFSTLASGTYSCTLSVADAAGNVSNTLTLAPFTVNAPVTTTTTSSGGSGGGGGGGGGIVGSGPLSVGYVNTNPQAGSTQTTTTTTTTGAVLGASTYNFTQSLSIGSTGEDVTQLQAVLIADGFLAIASPTGYYGSLTATAVKAYQLAHGLPQVGVVGPLTRAALNEGSVGATTSTTTTSGAGYSFANDLTIGSTGADVTALQNALTAAGDYTGPVTGYFGTLTEAAVKIYQTSKGISATGYVGPLTLAALNA